MTARPPPSSCENPTEALSIKRQEVMAQVRAGQARRGELRAQTGRVFVFLAALVAFVATQTGKVDSNLDRMMLGAAVLLATTPLLFIYYAKTPWREIVLGRIATSSIREAEESMIAEGERVLHELDGDITRARVYLIAAEKACAVIAFYLVGVTLALLVGNSPEPESKRATAAYLLLGLAALALLVFALRARRK